MRPCATGKENIGAGGRTWGDGATVLGSPCLSSLLWMVRKMGFIWVLLGVLIFYRSKLLIMETLHPFHLFVYLHQIFLFPPLLATKTPSLISPFLYKKIFNLNKMVNFTSSLYLSLNPSFSPLKNHLLKAFLASHTPTALVHTYYPVSWLWALWHITTILVLYSNVLFYMSL